MAPLATRERGAQTVKTRPDPAPAEQKDWPVSAAPARASKLPWKRILVIALAAVLLAGCYALYALVLQPAPARNIQLFTVTRRSFPVLLKERGELKAHNSIDIRSELEGRATIIYLITEGTHVSEGELLVELASDEIDNNIRDTESKEASALAAHEAAVKTRDIQRDENASKIRKASLQLRLAQMAYEKYTEGEQKELEQDARLAVEKAEVVLERKREDYKDAQDLFAENFITRIELKDAEFNEYAARLDLEKAKLNFEVLKKYTIPMDLETKKADIHEAEKELDRERKAAEAAEAKATAEVEAKRRELDIVRDKLEQLRDQKAKSRITAPAAGLVVYARDNHRRSETVIDTGTEVFERQLLLQLPDTSQMKVEVRIHEAQIKRLSLDMPATVQIEGFPGRTFTGKVSQIAVVADSQNYWLNPDLREYKTDILLDGTYTELKPNTTARVEIRLAELHDVLAVPVQAVFAKSGRFYVFVDEGGQVRPVQVEPGMSSTEFVEIKSGLTEGQNIRLAITDELKLLLPDDHRHDGLEIETIEDEEGVDDTDPVSAGRNRGEARRAKKPSTRPLDELRLEPGGSTPTSKPE